MEKKDHTTPSRTYNARKNLGKNPKYDGDEDENENIIQIVQSPTNTKSSQKLSKKNMCLDCGKIVNKCDHAMFCDGCSDWVHIQTGNRKGCVDHRMSIELYLAMKQDNGECKSVQYKCNYCTKGETLKDLREERREIRESYKELKNREMQVAAVEEQNHIKEIKDKLAEKDREKLRKMCEEKDSRIQIYEKETKEKDIQIQTLERENEELKKMHENIRNEENSKNSGKVYNLENEDKDEELVETRKKVKDLELIIQKLEIEKNEANKNEEKLRELLIKGKEECADMKKQLDIEKQEKMKLVYDKMEEEAKKKKKSEYQSKVSLMMHDKNRPTQNNQTRKETSEINENNSMQVQRIEEKSLPRREYKEKEGQEERRITEKE